MDLTLLVTDPVSFFLRSVLFRTNPSLKASVLGFFFSLFFFFFVVCYVSALRTLAPEGCLWFVVCV